MYYYLHKLFVFILFLMVLVHSNAELCANKDICTECIKQFDCAWCAEASNTRTQHCYEKSRIEEFCPRKDVINPKSKVQIMDNRPISTTIGKQINQIQPQHVRLSLRKDEEYTLNFRYGQAHDFPVDLYYLMDLSASLKNIINNLADNGEILVSTMKRVTSDFAIGFGSFVDKTTAPYISTIPKKIKEPCTGCVPAYSYINHLSMTSDGTEFANQVRHAKVSGNLDFPEGGFDALMQVMVCAKELGWRNNSRRIIVFTTDAPFHVAGDGKLAGIVIPNDGKCHLQANKYTEALTLDYPSISHINHIAKQNNFHILFIVTKKQKNLYKQLENAIENSRVVDLNEGTEITAEIEKFYQEISTSLKMTTNTSQNVHVSFSSNCVGNDFTKECNDVKADQIIDFKATIKSLNCFAQETIWIKPSTQDVALQVDLSTICDCECGQDIQNSPECNGKGNLHCGVCECHPGYNGKHCECNQANGEDYLEDSECKMGNDTENCSGRGTCLCNVCQCEKKSNPNQLITGKYCECDNYSCPKLNGLCSNNGECVCGKCKCNPDWSGGACECKNDNTTCMAANAVCNDHGSCECGRCKCEKHYFGRYCEECATCFGGKCAELKPCVECKVHQKGPFKDDCDFKCAQYTIIVVDTIEEDEDTDDVRVCRTIEDNCKMIFTYKYENDKIIASALQELQCSTPVNVFALVGYIIAGILLVGVLLLIVWKLWTNYQDKIEYAKFEEESQRGKWNRGENPLFVSPVTKFRNPTYGRNSIMSQRKSKTSSQSSS